MKFSDRDLQDLLGVIDARVERALRRQPRTEYGTVATTDGEVASVNLHGSASASEGFRIPSLFDAHPGDYVRVVIDPNGDRYIDANLSHAQVPKQIDQFLATDSGTLYPTGISYFISDSAAGYPTDSVLVTTIKQGNFRILQLVSSHFSTGHLWFRQYHDSTGWGAFVEVATL